MIVDLILDRKDGLKYDARKFYNQVVQYGKIGFSIASALDSGKNKDVQNAIAKYITENKYNDEIVKYTNSVNWS